MASCPDGHTFYLAAMNADLHPTAEKILLMLGSEAAESNTVKATERELAGWTGFSRSAVWRWLHILEDRGWLEAKRTHRAPTVWTLLLPGGA